MFTLPPDPYKILGITSKAQITEIRGAYRKLILKCHPDKVQDPEQKAAKQLEFQQVQQAYELLTDDKERTKYDDMVKLNDLQREMGKMSTSSPSSKHSMPRHASAYADVDIRTAEPRPSTFGSRSYTTHTSRNRSWEDELNTGYHRESPRSTRRTPSYDPLREEERLKRERESRQRRKEDEDWEREKERERIRAEKAEAAEKKIRKAHEREKDKKRAEKERKRESAEKRRPKERDFYIEEMSDPEEETVLPKKKPTSSRRYDEKDQSSSRPATERERKQSSNLEFAAQYLERSGGKPPLLGRSKTFQDTYRHVDPPMAPTPPPALFAAAPPPPPPAPRTRDILDEDAPRRSSAKSSSRRPSDAAAARSSRDKSTHKKSRSRAASREPRSSPIIVDPPMSPKAWPAPPPLQKSNTAPLSVPTERIPHLSRSSTDQYSRPMPQPIPHAASSRSYFGESERDRMRDRHAGAYSEDSEEDARRYRRAGRRTHSPDVMRTDTHRYVVENGKTIRQAKHPEEMSRSQRVKATYTPSSPYDHDEYGGAMPMFNHVKYSNTFDESEISYSGLPRDYTREAVY